MKLKFLFLTCCLLPLSVWAAKVQVNIEGMSCMSCEAKITKSLEGTGKCSQVRVNVLTKLATFETHKDREISDEEIKRVIKSAGYNAVKITRL